METIQKIRISVSVFVLFCVYLYLSFDTLEPTQAGIVFNRISYTLGDLEGNGRHWLGLGRSFIVFPLIVQTIEFSNTNSEFTKGGLLRSRTSDGLEVLLEVSLQYQLVYDQIPDVYRKFGADYEKVYIMLAMDAINRDATSYSASIFFSNRTLVQDGFEAEMVKVFQDEALCSLPFFQLRSVSLPNDFETAIQNTEVQKQDIRTATAERFHQQVSGQTKVRIADQTAQAIAQRAEADAETIRLNVDAFVGAFEISQGLQSTAFAEVYSALNDNETALIDYMNVRALNQHPDAKSIVNVQMPKYVPQ